MTTESDPSDDTRSWDILADCLDAFLNAWANEPPAAVADHLPVDPKIRRMVLFELLKADMECRKDRGLSVKTVETYAKEFAEFDLIHTAPADLLYEEYHIRCAAGESFPAEDYFKRYPKQEPQLRQLLGIASPDVSVTLNRPATTVEIKPGDSVEDFDLLLQLGEGGFAKVFLSRQKSMQRMVALKVSADVGTEPQTLAQFDHPNIVRVYDQRTLLTEKLRLLYMQFVAGGTLSPVIKQVQASEPSERTGRLLLRSIEEEMERSGQTPGMDSAPLKRLNKAPWAEVVCRIGAQLASALDYAHGKGVLHRDIKPANVLLTAHGQPKLADFNISFSKAVEGDDAQENFGGSLAYMSPEQLEACSPHHLRSPEDLDPRSDVYSLGVTLWELLTGERPFADEEPTANWSETVEQMLASRNEGPPEAQQKSRDLGSSDVEGHLKIILRKCLAPDREDRFASADELARALFLCLHPAAMRLLTPPRRGWRKLVRAIPLIAVLLVALIPNAVAGVFNYAYNQEAIANQLASSGAEGAKAAFWNTQLIINLIAFPVGVALLAALTWGVARHIDQDEDHGAPIEDGQFARDRARALRLGEYAAIIGACEWAIAGFAYPLSMRFLLGEFPPSHMVHFFLSLTLCGLIAATYPFFLVSFLSVRVFYPALLRKNLAAETDSQTLVAMGKKTGVFLLASAVVPALGVLSCVTLELAGGAGGHVHTIALVVLSLLGAFGFGLTFWLYRRLQADLAALLGVVRPPDWERETEGVTSF